MTSRAPVLRPRAYAVTYASAAVCEACSVIGGGGRAGCLGRVGGGGFGAVSVAGPGPSCFSTEPWPPMALGTRATMCARSLPYSFLSTSFCVSS